MSHPITSELLAALGIATYEKVTDRNFKSVGQMPAWLADVKPELLNGQPSTCLSEVFPFLEYFLTDVETQWPHAAQQIAKSGLWSEQTQAGETLYLEASILAVGTKQLLLIAAQEASANEKGALIQKARENSLSYSSDRRQNSQELVNSTFYDALTGLPNQTYLSLQLTQAFEICRQDKAGQSAILMISIDQFNLLASSLGHVASEQLLVQFAWRIKEYLIPETVLARCDSNEFALLFPYVVSFEQVTHLSNRILTVLKSPFTFNNQEVVISANMGLARSREEYKQAQDLWRDAHTAMEQAKTLGGAQLVIFEPFMHHQAVRQFQLENDLYQAVGDQDLQIHYQPILTIKGEVIEGFEAFVRWFHPQRGSIAPLKFLPVAESIGLMSAIDLWLMREACFRIQQWCKVTHAFLTVSVNVSAVQFKQPHLAQQISQVLKETNIKPQHLQLEFHEQVLLKHLTRSRLVLEQLRALGVQLCVDDFSGSYAAMNALQQLPLNTLKLAPSCLTSLMHSQPQYQTAVGLIIQLAHELKIKVSAKGVENNQQLQALAKVGCNDAQGYFLAGPLNGTRAAQLLSQQQQFTNNTT
ncbi:putative signaling protein [Acaryochloris thomasi RCC1774]|uniref:Putative signaling protein n=1 Tax=Acaryochloris thomasi RCC1774 TaxID=1764569 RepID=A0A2W1JVG3_9CYAN|nr:bifunctional diguanylate cyclase/phosphodiesterase [Acaryochloris thomasi]PZD73724.1 putative signaling protein [Acaryochloris thomasi RCC1774]